MLSVFVQVRTAGLPAQLFTQERAVKIAAAVQEALLRASLESLLNRRSRR